MIAILIILAFFVLNINIFIMQGTLDVQASKYLIMMFLWMTAKHVSAHLAFFNVCYTCTYATTCIVNMFAACINLLLL